jgi:hypothetical protein
MPPGALATTHGRTLGAKLAALVDEAEELVPAQPTQVRGEVVGRDEVRGEDARVFIAQHL